MAHSEHLECNWHCSVCTLSVLYWWFNIKLVENIWYSVVVHIDSNNYWKFSFGSVLTISRRLMLCSNVNATLQLRYFIINFHSNRFVSKCDLLTWCLILTGSLLTMPMIDGIMAEVPPLINESDLHISQLTLNLLSSLCRVHPGSTMKLYDEILAEVLVLIRSPLLQGRLIWLGSSLISK